MARLSLGCQRLGLSLPNTRALKCEITELLAQRAEAVVKLILTRTTSHRGYSPLPSTGVERVVQVFDMPDIYNTWQSDGINIGLCHATISENTALAGIKHLNRLEQVLAAKEVTENGWEEGLMRTRDARIVCGTKSNFFVIIDDVIHTCELQNCGVAGVMRAEILDLARSLKLNVVLGDFTESELHRAQGMFISNALVGIAPVSTFHFNDGAGFESLSFENNTLIEALQIALKN